MLPFLTKQQFLSDTYGGVFLAGLPLSSSGGFDPFLGKKQDGKVENHRWFGVIQSDDFGKSICNNMDVGNDMWELTWYHG